MSYEEKYLKYKNKYDSLKSSIINNQIGGSAGPLQPSYAPPPPPPPSQAPQLYSCNDNTGNCYNDNNGIFWPSITACNSVCKQQQRNPKPPKQPKITYNTTKYIVPYYPTTIPVVRSVKSPIYYDDDDDYRRPRRRTRTKRKSRRKSRRKSTKRKSRRKSRRKSIKRKSTKRKSTKRKSKKSKRKTRN